MKKGDTVTVKATGQKGTIKDILDSGHFKGYNKIRVEGENFDMLTNPNNRNGFLFSIDDFE